MTKLKVITKKQKQRCWACGGKGCKVCKYTGEWIEKHYILIHGKYAIDKDTLE